MEFGYIRNTSHGPYWRDQSLAPEYDRVQCAVLLIEGWADWYATEELRSFQRLSAPRKVLIGPWGHYYAEEKEAFPGPRIDARREYLKWFDHWLKGIDNGVMQEPPVTVFVRLGGAVAAVPGRCWHVAERGRMAACACAAHRAVPVAWR